MKMANDNVKVTDREMDVLNIMWTKKEPLVASDICKINPSLSINTVRSVLRNLLKRNSTH